MEGQINSSTSVNLTDFSMRGMPLPSSQLLWQAAGGVAHIQGAAMGGQGILDLTYNFNSKEMSGVRAELKQFDFSPLLLLLNPKSIQDNSLVGRISAYLNLTFHAGQIERGNGTVELSDYLLARTDSVFQLSRPSRFKVTDGSFDINGLAIKGKTGEIVLDLGSKHAELDGRISGNLDTSLAEFFTPTVVQSTGTAKLDLAVGGTIKEPTLFGSALLNGGSVRLAHLESPFENITGKLQLRQNVLSVQNVQADLGGGRVTTEGKVVVYADSYPEISLKADINHSKLKVYPFQFAKVNGSIDVHGKGLPYLVAGHISVDSALCKEKVLNQKQGVQGLKALRYAPPVTKQGESSQSKFALNIDVEAMKGILIQNDLFQDMQAKGKLTLVNTLDAPRVLGRAEVIQGRLLFKDHVFQIQTATANFDNPTVINPAFDLTANTEVNGVKIQMYATGRPDKIKVEFTSNPAMQESELLSLLAIGLTSNDAKKLSATDLNALQQGEAASLVLHSLDFNRDLEDKTGFHVQVDESVNPQQGVSAFRPQAQADSAAAPQITIRKKLGDRLSVSGGSTVGAGTNKATQVNLDFSMNKDLSITGVFNNYGTYGASDQQNSQNAPSFGLDLKFQKRFK